MDNGTRVPFVWRLDPTQRKDRMPLDKPINVLFLGTHNSARSILAQACLNHLGKGRFRAYSAGSTPHTDPRIDPLALEVLHQAGIPTEGLYSKSWDVFAAADAPHMDLVITLCDNVSGQVCPCWPGHPATAHWSYPAPTQLSDSQEPAAHAYRRTLFALGQHIEALVSLPMPALDRLVLEQTVREMART